MLCPNCNFEMSDSSYMYYGLGSWDLDYPDMIHERYKCKVCKISYDSEKGWKVPPAIGLPTEKQINCVKVINQVLGTEFVPVLKSQTAKFIKENMEKSKAISKQYKYCPTEDDLYEFCDNDVWCEYY